MKRKLCLKWNLILRTHAAGSCCAWKPTKFKHWFHTIYHFQFTVVHFTLHQPDVTPGSWILYHSIHQWMMYQQKWIHLNCVMFVYILKMTNSYKTESTIICYIIWYVTILLDLQFEWVTSKILTLSPSYVGSLVTFMRL